MTSTSEIWGNASSAILLSAQIPPSTRKSAPVKTRKRFRAHQSIHRAIMLHPSCSVHVQLLTGDGLSIVLRQDCGLPRSSASQHTCSFIDALAFVAESDGSAHCRHSHCRHGGHGECHRDFRPGDWRAIRIRESYTEDIASLVGWARLRT